MTIGKHCRDCFYAGTHVAQDPCRSCVTFDKFVDARSFKDDAVDTYKYVVNVPAPEYDPRVVKFSPIVNQPFTIKPEGKKYDSGKPDWSLLPFKAVSETVDVLTFGANKYGPENWRLVPNAKKRYLAAAFRHIVAYVTGEKKDSESGLSHLSHALCCLLFILELEKSDDTSNT